MFYLTFQTRRKASQSYSKVFSLLGIKFASSSVRKVSGKRMLKTFKTNSRGNSEVFHNDHATVYLKSTKVTQGHS